METKDFGNQITGSSMDDKELNPPISKKSKKIGNGIEILTFCDASGAPVYDDDYFGKRNLRSAVRSTLNRGKTLAESPRESQHLPMEDDIPQYFLEEDRLARKEAKSKREPKKPQRSFEAFEAVLLNELLTYHNTIIRIEDYIYLDRQEMLGHVVLDFYLQYFHREIMPQEFRERVHIYSPFFYNLYSTAPTYAGWKDEDIPASEKRYKRVEGLHDINVNIFDKDFLVFPCLEGQHWFLAIACYLKLNGSVTVDENIAITREEDKHRDPKDPSVGRPIKSSCILVFDSVKGASRKTKAMKHIKNFLETEFMKKYQTQQGFTFLKDTVTGSAPHCPQQTNCTDCGLFVIEFVEHFFMKSPITDFRLPIDLSDWFDPKIVSKKREEIAKLIQRLILEEKGDLPLLPPIKFSKDVDDPSDEAITVMTDPMSLESKTLNYSRAEDDKLNNNNVSLDFNTIEHHTNSNAIEHHVDSDADVITNLPIPNAVYDEKIDKSHDNQGSEVPNDMEQAVTNSPPQNGATENSSNSLQNESLCRSSDDEGNESSVIMISAEEE